MFGRLKYWAAVLFKDDVPEEVDQALLPPTFFNPRTEYLPMEVTPLVIIDNHLAHLDDKLNMIGGGMERIWKDVGFLKGVVGILKRILVALAMSAIAYTTQNFWGPALTDIASKIVGA